MVERSLVDYSRDVIGLGDHASETLQESCKIANRKTFVARYFDEASGYELKKGTAAKESIDGVGTKVQIYTEAFEGYFLAYEKGEIDDVELTDIAIDIWERMLHDLIAMNTDDLRNGEMAVAITNIIDVNHLKGGERGSFFVDSLAGAMGRVIEELDIMITAGETAILGEPKKVGEIIEAVEDVLNSISNKPVIGFIASPFVKMVRKGIKDKLASILPKIEFNIGGTSLGITQGEEKLVPIEEGHDIIVFEETPHNDIRGPRSNGLTAIRDMMTELAGRGWENLTFEEFLSIPEVNRRGSAKINGNIKKDCEGKKMWEIATGKTTVFNPFVSRELLGGVKPPEDTNVISLDRTAIRDQSNISGEAEVQISSIIHVTGNPGKKALDGFKGHSATIHNQQIPEPHIVSILCSLYDIDTKEAIEKWNINMPYMLTCPPSETEKILEKAKSNGFVAEKRGTVGKHMGNEAIITLEDRLDDDTIEITSSP